MGRKIQQAPVVNNYHLHGMNWIRQERRLAIYIRDGLACIWCLQGIEHDIILTLDHLVPTTRHGTNATKNLITSCKRCNNNKHDMPYEHFAQLLSDLEIVKQSSEEICERVIAHIHKPIDVNAAKTLIKNRGSAKKVISHMRSTYDRK